MISYSKSWFRSFRQSSGDSARHVVPLLIQLIGPRSVVDFGCGLGVWLAQFEQNGVRELRGIDGHEVGEADLLIDANSFSKRDLTLPVRLNRKFDLCLCLEVAEHLPESAGNILVDSLTRSSSIVFFSAAVPAQGGRNHLNEQWPDYWADKFRERGFYAIDAIRRHIWDNLHVDYWYAQNALVYADQKAIERHPKLREEYERTTPGQLALIHPRLFQRTANDLRKTVDYRVRGAFRNVKAIGKKLIRPKAA